MHSDRDIERAAQQLAKFCIDGEAYHKAQAEVLEKYASLMEDFKRLKSDYEEERDSRERYKQLARGQERNAFVLVLVDGDGLVFDDELISGGAEGGSLAAQRLNDAIKKSLRIRGLDHCHVMVRIYANLAGLSRAASKAKLCGYEKRSLAPFVASFNKSIDLFDFIDAGELKENVDFKIRAMLRQFAVNSQCKHIYFAACHDVGYISELTPFINNKDRITLVRTSASHHEFGKLGLKMEELPHIFRSTPLPADQQPQQQQQQPYQYQYQYQGSTDKPSPQTPYSHALSSSTDQDIKKICHFFARGMCKYGESCSNVHAKPVSSAHDFLSGAGQQGPIDFKALLPTPDEIPIDQIPVNKHQQRLDSYAPRPSSADHTAFTSRVSHGKLCNSFHLKGTCPKGNTCEYDHKPISDGIRNQLLSMARNLPCPRRGGCRLIDCTNGHVCQKRDCKYRGGKSYCKLPAAMHSVDLNVSKFEPGVKPSSKDTGDEESGSTNGKGYSCEEDLDTPQSDADSEHEGSSMEQGDRGEASLLVD